MTATDKPKAPPRSPYFDGVRAYQAGVVAGDNPHLPDTDAHWRWMKGWVDCGMETYRAAKVRP